MSGYDKYATKASAKIRRYGSPITVRRSGKRVYDQEKNAYSDSGEEFSGVAIQRNFAQKNVDGTNIRFGDVLFMACLDGRPKSGDSVDFGGKAFTVVSVEPMCPDGKTDIYVNIQARQ